VERTLSFKRTPVPSFEKLILSYDATELESAFRSTIPLLCFVRDGEQMLEEVLARCGMTGPLQLHFEFTIKPPKGRGKASHTDLLVESQARSFAIEAKWTEPMYNLVSAWLLKQNRASNNYDHQERNSEREGGGWRTLIRSRAGRDLVAKDFAECMYQMVHRAASACHDEAKQPQLAYFKFSPSPDPNAAAHNEYQYALATLHKILGNPADFPVFLVDIQMSPTRAFHAIEKLPQGERATSALARDALAQSKLFDFLGYRIERIGTPDGFVEVQRSHVNS
jgi:hypothetical protein